MCIAQFVLLALVFAYIPMHYKWKKHRILLSVAESFSYCKFWLFCIFVFRHQIYNRPTLSPSSYNSTKTSFLGKALNCGKGLREGYKDVRENKGRRKLQKSSHISERNGAAHSLPFRAGRRRGFPH